MSQSSDISQVNSLQSTIKISAWLGRLYNSIKEKKSKGQNTDNEEKTLMSACVAENPTVGLLGCQLLIKAADEDVLPVSKARTLLLSMLPSADGSRFAAVSTALCQVIITEFRKQCMAARKKEPKMYICPYGLQHPEHPFIAILSCKKGHGHDIAIKVKELFNHENKYISNGSTEFLRPVYLYIVKNMDTITSIRTLWSLLVQQSLKSDLGNQLFRDCLMWFSCQNSTLLTNVLLNDALDAFIPKRKPENTIKVLLTMLVSLPNQVKLGLDPRQSFALVMRVLQNDTCADIVPHGLILLICIDILDEIPPVYIDDLLIVIKHLEFEYNIGDILIHRMLLDSLILWSVDDVPVSETAKTEIKALKQHIEKKDALKCEKINEFNLIFTNRLVGLYMDLERIRCKLEFLMTYPQFDDIVELVKSFVPIKTATFTRVINKMMRGLMLSHSMIPLMELRKISPYLSKMLSEDEENASKFLTTFQYEIGRITSSSLKLEILRNAVECAHFRSNISTILTLLRNFSENNRDFQGDVLKLYLRLWQIDPRTYQYLYDQISRGRGNSNREINLVRVEVLKTICEKNPTQHGADLVTHLSDLLNQSSSPTDDGAVICTVLETIILLCESHTVSIIGIWKALGFAFRYEKRPKVLMTLCLFFGELPNYASQSPEYESMSQEIYQRLWDYALTSKYPEVKESAFKALAKFPLDRITIKQIPQQFRENLKLPKSKLGPDVDPLDTLTFIPGECWLQLLMKVEKNSVVFAGDLIAAHIRREIQEYRGSVYNVPSGKGEPEDLSYLPPKSILRPFIKFIHQQANISHQEASDNFHLVHCLRVLSQKFPKPIPPVNWSCLLPIFTQRDKNRQYCISIAVTQSVISGTAKRFLCDYLGSFEALSLDECEREKEMFAIFDKLPTFLDTIDSQLTQQYIKQCFKNTYKPRLGASVCSLEDKMATIRSTLTEAHLGLITDPILNALEECSELNAHHNFLHIFSPFESKHLTFWTNFAVVQFNEEFKRDICYNLTQQFHDITLLNPIILHISDRSQKYNSCTQWSNIHNIEDGMKNVFMAFQDHPEKCLNWCLLLLADMQCSMDAKLSLDFQKCFTVFTECINNISGYSAMTGPIRNYDGKNLMDAFPQALMLLSEKEQWKDLCNQIFDFFFDFVSNDFIRQECEHQAKILKRVLIYSLDLPHFNNKSTWTKLMMNIKYCNE